MKRVELAEILNLLDYEKVRDAARARNIELTKTGVSGRRPPHVPVREPRHRLVPVQEMSAPSGSWTRPGSGRRSTSTTG
jgi:hypothetical protein